jgi:hypothetical protein
MVEKAGTKKKAFASPEHALHTSCLLLLVVCWMWRACLDSRCRRRIVGGRRWLAGWLTKRTDLLLAVCAIGSRGIATLQSKAQVMLAVAVVVAGGRRCCGEGWPCSCLGGLAMNTWPWTPMPVLPRTQCHQWLLVAGDASASQEKMSRRPKMVVVREFADHLQEASISPNKTAIPSRQASSERRLQCTNTPNQQHLNNHASGPFQIEDGACKHLYLTHLLFRLSIHGLCSSVHNCGRY